MGGRTGRRGGRAVALAAITGAFLTACSNNNGQNSLDPAGESSRTILNLFTPVFWIAVAIGVGVVAAILFAVFRYRERTGDEQPRQVHGSTPLEIGWTIAPAVILAVIAVPTLITIFNLSERPSGPDVLQVTVTGKQWWWQFEYPEQDQLSGPAVATANELHLPVDTDVELHLQACDAGPAEGTCNVIHSFWVPELAGKTDVIPGRNNFVKINAERTGTFLGQCAEYCGLSHANMRIRVIVQTREEFDAWLAQQQQPGPELNTTEVDAQGNETQVPIGPPDAAPTLIQTTFGCTNCHSIGDSSASSFGPNLAHLASRDYFAGATYELTRENLVDWVMDAPGMVPMDSELGCPSPDLTCVGMPSFTKGLPGGTAPMTRQQAETIADFLLEERK